MTSRRQLLEKVIKSWAQDHHYDYVIADMEPTEKAMQNTQGYLTWLIREGQVNLDLLSLVERLEIFLNNKNINNLDGMFCKKCQNFVQYAEPNQPDGLMVCYVCRQNPYK